MRTFLVLLILMMGMEVTMPDNTAKNTRDLRPQRTQQSGQPQWWQYANQYQPKPPQVNTYGRGRGTNRNNNAINPGGNIPGTYTDANYYANQQRLEDAKKRERETQRTGTFSAGGGTLAPTPTGPTYANYSPTNSQVIRPNKPPALPQVNIPAWLQGRGGGTTVTSQNANPARTQNALTGTFLAGGGSVVQSPTGQGVPSYIPTGSVNAGAGDYVMGQNQGAYWMGAPGVNTFLGGGNEAVRGPDYPMAIAGGGGGGYGGYSPFGSRYRGWGGGGGGGYGGSGYSNVPRWMMGLNSWNFNE